MTTRPFRRKRRLVNTEELAAVIRRTLMERGLSVKEAALALGVDEGRIVRAERTGYGLMIRLRKQILERMAGGTLEGPYYVVRELSQREGGEAERR